LKEEQVKKLAIIAIAAVAGAANAAVYSNGPVTDGVNSSNIAISKLIAPGSLFGAGAQVSANNAVADDFVVTGPGWNVSRISFFMYQTNATSTTFTFTGANASIVTGSDPNGGTSVYSATGAAVSNGGFVGYRVASTTPDVTNRPIFRVDITGLNINLAPGAHTLRWSVNGSLASGPWAPPVAPFAAGNATQSINGAPYAPLLDAGLAQQMTLPFEVEYTPVPEPATMLALGAGIAAVAARRRRK
jgi:hypothetical protein